MTKEQQAPAIPSASLIVVRDGAKGIEILLLKRNPQLTFAPDSLVFPGGRLDEGDQAIAASMRQAGCGLEHLDLRIACIREAFEEANILHAKRQGAFLSQSDLRGFKRCRDYLLEGRFEFEKMLSNKSLQLAVEDLYYMAHWITPEGLSKRFSTHFFVAVQPSNQRGEPDGGEILYTLWQPVRELGDYLDDDNKMMFPTRLNCDYIANFSTVDELLAAVKEKTVVSVLPKVKMIEGEPWFVIPEDAGYSETGVKITEADK